MSAPYASAGSQRWLQIAVDRAPGLLDAALRREGAIGPNECIDWKSPLKTDGFTEYRDAAALRLIDADPLPKRSLAAFWPRRGPVWDALGLSSTGIRILVEAKAHIAEAASPPSQASEHSLAHIRESLAEARKFYAPKAKADWSGNLYQYANRLAFQYLLNRLNGLPTRLIFVDFLHAKEMSGPESYLEWKGATRLIHALLGLPLDLSVHGVYHIYIDVRELEDAL